MESESLVSIIVPVYNREKYIKKAIDSVLQQTYKNIEIIIVDDGSTDESYSICIKEFGKMENIKIYKNSNHGCSYTRNFGMDHSSGEYILFLDSDDWIEITMVEDMVTTIEKDNSDVVICGMIMGNYQEGKLEKLIPRADSREYFWFSDRCLISSPVNKLFKRNIIKRENIYFPENTNYGEDLCFSFYYLLNCSKISLLKKCLYNYRLHGDNSVCDLEKRRELFVALRTIYEYINKKNLQLDICLMKRFRYLSREHIKSTFTKLLSDRENFLQNYKEYKIEYQNNIKYFNQLNQIHLKLFMFMIIICYKTNSSFILNLKSRVKRILKKSILKPYFDWKEYTKEEYVK